MQMKTSCFTREFKHCSGGYSIQSQAKNEVFLRNKKGVGAINLFFLKSLLLKIPLKIQERALHFRV
jgi:hypothetical protein